MRPTAANARALSTRPTSNVVGGVPEQVKQEGDLKNFYLRVNLHRSSLKA